MTKMWAIMYDGVDKEHADRIYNSLIVYMNKKEAVNVYDGALCQFKGRVNVTDVLKETSGDHHVISINCESELNIDVHPKMISFEINGSKGET